MRAINPKSKQETVDLTRRFIKLFKVYPLGNEHIHTSPTLKTRDNHLAKMDFAGDMFVTRRVVYNF